MFNQSSSFTGISNLGGVAGLSGASSMYGNGINEQVINDLIGTIFDIMTNVKNVPLKEEIIIQLNNGYLRRAQELIEKSSALNPEFKLALRNLKVLKSLSTLTGK